MKIIFMGTPDFAVPSLKALIEAGHEVQAVFTQAPKPAGRGYKLVSSPVHKLAEQHNLAVHTPSTLRDPAVQQLIHDIAAEVVVVVAYGFIIPKAILNAKKYGCLNIHPSSLPRFRGAAPLQRTIQAGDTETSVCIMQMNAGLDTGDIILSQQLNLLNDIDLTTLSLQTSNIGAHLLLKVLNNIDTLPRFPQTEDGLIYAHKLEKIEGRINWHESAVVIDRQIRAFNPWPGTYFMYNDAVIKVKKATVILNNHDYPPGFVINNELLVACHESMLQIEVLQRSGRSPQFREDFSLGYNIVNGTILS